MTLADIAALRLSAQHISSGTFQTPRDLVGWMGAMQAQDFPMSQWAIGARLPDATEADVKKALDEGVILRTHVLRPTWHLVSAGDIYWMQELTAPHIRASMNARHKQLELDAAVLSKTNKILEKTLEGGRHRSRQEVLDAFTKAGIALNDNRAAHLLFSAELDCLICSGVTHGNGQTYALLEERVPRPASINRPEALARLAQRYFSSHGPATLADFIWWSGLPVRDARNALEMVRSEFVFESIEGETYWFSPSISDAAKGTAAVLLLPAFDEFIISYKDRKAALASEHHKKAVSENGIFRPVIVVNGRVKGLWKRSFKKDKVLVETGFFQQPDPQELLRTEQAAAAFGRFLDKTAELVFSQGNVN